jgi:hypothetical protein
MAASGTAASRHALQVVMDSPCVDSNCPFLRLLVLT